MERCQIWLQKYSQEHTSSSIKFKSILRLIISKTCRFNTNIPRKKQHEAFWRNLFERIASNLKPVKTKRSRPFVVFNGISIFETILVLISSVNLLGMIFWIDRFCTFSSISLRRFIKKIQIKVIDRTWTVPSLNWVGLKYWKEDNWSNRLFNRLVSVSNNEKF